MDRTVHLAPRAARFEQDLDWTGYDDADFDPRVELGEADYSALVGRLVDGDGD